MVPMLILKASVLLGSALLVARLFGRAPAATRHRLWTVVFAGVLALPILAAGLPSFHVPVPASWASTSARIEPLAAATVPAVTDPNSASRQENRSRTDASHTAAAAIAPSSTSAAGGPVTRNAAWFTMNWPATSTLLFFVWLMGTAVAGTMLLLSLLRARRLARASQEMHDPAWRAVTDALRTRLGLDRPVRLLLCPHVGTPMAGGVWRARIFLPSAACDWTDERRDVVLAHEMTHLAGRDPLRHLLARVAVAIYWFHPLAWIAAAQATVAREQACDEAVLELGTRPSTYARVLLELAESMPKAVPALGALPMLERSLLERRLMAILADAARPATRRRVLIPGIGVALFTLSVAAATPTVTGPAASGLTVDKPTTDVAVPHASSTRLPQTAAVRPAPVAGAQATPTPAAQPAPKVASQSDTAREFECWTDNSKIASFSGSVSMSESGGRRVIREQIGTQGSSRVVQKDFGDLRVCMVADNVGAASEADRPSLWLGRADRVVMETRRGDSVRRLEIRRTASNEQRVTWHVGGGERAFNAAAQQWRDRLLTVLDTTWELSTLRGRVSTLQGEISTVHGMESTLHGEISTLRGQVSTMQGHASTIRGEESTFHGHISTIRGHLSSLQGAISTEQGAISSITAASSGLSETDRAILASSTKKHKAEIARLEKEIKDYNADARVGAVEKDLAALNADGKVAAIEADIRKFDLNGKVAEVERRIKTLDVPGKVAAIESQIKALDADRRGRELEARLESERKQLDAVVR